MDLRLAALLAAELDALERVHRRRRLRALAWREGALHDAAGRRLIDVSSNDYLGLSQHPLVRERAAEYASRHGAGAPASRLVSGTRDITAALEARLAAFKGCEAALLLSSGFQANATVIPALARIGEDRATLFSDALNHASMIHGAGMAKAAGCRVEIYAHNDLADLDARLAACPGRKLILTESVFSMDGDRANLAAIAALAARHGAALYVDEAHASGVLGAGGRGLAYGLGADAVMGTLGKGFGAFGAFVAGSQALVDYLVNRCGGLIYTTALPPPVLGAVDAALDLMPELDAQRCRLAHNAERLRHALTARGLDCLHSSTQIVPAVIGGEPAALAAARRLDDFGILAVAIRPPTVAPGTSRLRFALSSALDDAAMETLLAAIAAL